jgi:hypothetical protein
MLIFLSDRSLPALMSAVRTVYAENSQMNAVIAGMLRIYNTDPQIILVKYLH